MNTNPLPNKSIQLSLCYLALNLTSALSEVIEEFIEDKKSLDQLNKVQRWVKACSDNTERLPKHSASYRASDKDYQSILKKIHENIPRESIRGDTISAWLYCVYCHFLDAYAISNNLLDGNWRYLAMTLGTLAENFYERFPTGGAIGYQTYLSHDRKIICEPIYVDVDGSFCQQECAYRKLLKMVPMCELWGSMLSLDSHSGKSYRCNDCLDCDGGDL